MSIADSTAAGTGPQRKRRWWPVVKWTLFVIMLYFVGHRAVALWRDSPRIPLHVNGWWLIPAAVLYLLGWLPSVWFWRALLKRMNHRPGWYATLRAYYVGHLGKYIPGKALVLVIRGALLKDAGVNPVLGGLTAAYETLVSMTAGAAIAVALAPAVIPEGLWERLPAWMQFLRQQPLLVPVVVFTAALASTPFSAWLFTRVGARALPQPADAVPIPRITARLVAQGFLITSLTWVLHALSLGCTLQAISDAPPDLAEFSAWLASVSLSSVTGFAVLIAPGGLGVREWLLIETLKDRPAIGGEKAIIAAGLTRIVWFVAELGIAGLLYAIKPRPRGLPSRQQTTIS
jgi:uncharacterized membrane protein YbhN (UPF0104 family)